MAIGLTKNQMYEDLLNRVAEEQQQFGCQLQPAATDEQIATLISRAKRELQLSLPVEYLEFLRTTNGLDWNGVLVYASSTVPITAHPDRTISSVVDMNLGYRDDSRFGDLLVLGSNGMDLYTYRISIDEYEVYDEVPHELIDTLLTFDELMSKILTRSLQ